MSPARWRTWPTTCTTLRILRMLGNATLGHLHAWNQPPSHHRRIRRIATRRARKRRTSRPVFVLLILSTLHVSPAVDMPKENETVVTFDHDHQYIGSSNASSYVDYNVFRRLRGGVRHRHHEGAHYEPSAIHAAVHPRDGAKSLATSASRPTRRSHATLIAPILRLLLPLTLCALVRYMMPGPAGPAAGAQPNIGVVRARNIRVPDPPSWGPEQERHNPFRRWCQELMIWGIQAVDLDPAQQVTAIIGRLTGDAKEMALNLSFNEIT